jgi:hypothetical protein
MRATGLVVLVALPFVTGCSGMPSLSTGSIFGGSKPEAAALATPAAVTGDPTSRAFQVGTVAARAKKCGYNFDTEKLKASFLASEIGGGATDADMPRITQIYDVAYNGVTKAIAADPQYCSETKTNTIKADLARHLAGDFTPSVVKKPVEDGGLFSGWGSGSDTPDKGPMQTLPQDNSKI